MGYWIEHVSHEEYLEHSAKGTTWKNHKYVEKKVVNGKTVYIYKRGGTRPDGREPLKPRHDYLLEDRARNAWFQNRIAGRASDAYVKFGGDRVKAGQRVKAAQEKLKEYQKQLKKANSYQLRRELINKILKTNGELKQAKKDEEIATKNEALAKKNAYNSQSRAKKAIDWINPRDNQNSKATKTEKRTTNVYNRGGSRPDKREPLKPRHNYTQEDATKAQWQLKRRADHSKQVMNNVSDKIDELHTKEKKLEDTVRLNKFGGRGKSRAAAEKAERELSEVRKRIKELEAKEAKVTKQAQNHNRQWNRATSQ